jgi:hypothetical protein
MSALRSAPGFILAGLLVQLGQIRASAQTVSASHLRIYECNPGPWGNVLWHYIYIEAPDWIVEQFPVPNTQPAWSFPNLSFEKVRKLLEGAGVSASRVAEWLADKRAVLKGPEAVTLFPSIADIERLLPSAREIIYAELAKSQRNEFHSEPIYILDRTVDEWLGAREVRPEIKRIFERLSYKRGDLLAFSDVSVLLAAAKDSDEARDLMQLCTRTRAIMAFLQIDSTSDRAKIENYRSASFRRKDVLPILQSISQLPGGGRLGFAHILPAHPRKLVYTFPTFDMAAAGRLPDCHWTTLNFFNYRVENLFLDTRLATSRVLQGYTKVNPPYAFGDGLFFLDKEGSALHSCIYLCDDLVFTKNGENLASPWIISRLGTIERIYGKAGSVHIQGYRRNWDK